MIDWAPHHGWRICKKGVSLLLLGLIVITPQASFAVDSELHDHLWRFAKSKGACITLTFHAPVLARDYADRKVLSKFCHENVLGGLQCADTRPTIAA